MTNPFFSITNLGNSIRGLFQGTDRFTRGLNVGGDYYDFVGNYNTPQEVYETISNNEMRLFKTLLTSDTFSAMTWGEVLESA
jgi:hypothetical protein